MTKVISLSSPRAGVSAPSSAPQPNSVQRQAAIENALTMALYFVRQPGETAANVWAATARTNRALTLLKQASYGTTPAHAATALGRV